ncbi:MAG: SpoIIE family protein phosphatase [Oscillochloridaceae bacterium]|nr:serine/threonine-protein phosphatase [Chloroflexaceae bacterium]MDW8389737.1 SpoIIE family protein phosphatase [Oscillochloridaceae bacterium]
MDVEWGASNRPKQGQEISGDAYVIEPFSPHGLAVSLIDGLGGGEGAAFAARSAAAVIRSAPAQDPAELIQRAHLALRGTRGVVMAVLSYNLQQRSVSFVGVGNIGVQVYSAVPIKPISKNGIVGYRLPSLLKLAYSYHPGDTFVLYTDGISSDFIQSTAPESAEDPQSLAESIVRRYAKDHDDASVVVVRING